MPNPTRAQILNAHEALEELKNVALSAADFCGDTEKYLAWKSEIIAALPPKPQPTMNEIEWDDNKHYLAEAEHPTFGKVIMLFQNVDTGNIFVNFYKDGERNLVYGTPEYLTPTGKRYTLTEVQE
ncbi:hypothetical protein RAE07_11625 [Corynebacterium kefirresidentii]|uniref:hypothetical protein n=1 Tax=Corynebacterium sp. CTNIH14 TaxID=3230065 RepID=UPI002934EB8C|nr:hypothetical protein [Corynebacterium kefirresidentii]MDV2415955.1 hypothetical protein [Corynebacterium kefirresidentii]